MNVVEGRSGCGAASTAAWPRIAQLEGLLAGPTGAPRSDQRAEHIAGAGVVPSLQCTRGPHQQARAPVLTPISAARRQKRSGADMHRRFRLAQLLADIVSEETLMSLAMLRRTRRGC